MITYIDVKFLLLLVVPLDLLRLQDLTKIKYNAKRLKCMKVRKLITNENSNEVNILRVLPYGGRWGSGSIEGSLSMLSFLLKCKIGGT